MDGLIITVLSRDSYRKFAIANVYVVKECLYWRYRKHLKAISSTIPGQNRPWSKPVVRITAEVTKTIT
jgi:hypothetical protein